MVALTDLALLLALFLLIYHIWRAQGLRERCIVTVQRHLASQDLQLLDENIALRALWFKRNRRGQFCLWRRYHFEFSAQGDERYQGRVITLGEQIESIQLQAHRLPDERSH